MTTRALNRATLARQGLLEREAVAPAEMAERLVGLQAQEPLPPLIGLWTRCAGVTREQLEGLIASGALVRATLMRGTLHLVTPADYRRLRPAVQPLLDQVLARHAYTKDLDLAAVGEAARKVFGTGTLDFDEVRDRLAPRFPDANPRGLGYAARLLLPLVAAPDGGFRIEETGRAIANAKLAQRYAAAFGPASAADFRAWSGLKADDGLAADDGPAPDPDTPAPVRFIPAFDNLVLAHKDRSRVVPPAHQGKVTTKNLRVNPVFLVDGFAAGTWKADTKRKTAKLVLEPFGRLTKKARGELEQEGEALLRFLAPDASGFAVT
ncbi:MAG: winged helix DNA-binding domain-containing protein [Solirubrobacteraceae bacterium]